MIHDLSNSLPWDSQSDWLHCDSQTRIHSHVWQLLQLELCIKHCSYWKTKENGSSLWQKQLGCHCTKFNGNNIFGVILRNLRSFLKIPLFSWKLCVVQISQQYLLSAVLILQEQVKGYYTHNLKVNMFCVLSKNYQHFFWKIGILKQIVQETLKWHWTIDKPSGF